MKALFVIDMQEGCVGENHAKIFKYDNKQILESVNKVINENKDNTVIYIKNIMKKNLINKFAPFKAYEGSEEVKLVKNLYIISNHIFVKYTGDALKNNKLLGYLNEKNIDEIEVIGVDGGGCVSLTALGAIKRGYKVIVNTNAIGTTFTKNRDKYYKILKKKGTIFI